MTHEYVENMQFEDDVRRVAEAVWQLEPGECQPQHYGSNQAIHELDGLARLRDISHLIMATVSRNLGKVREDVKKLKAAALIEGRPDRPVAMWLITKYKLDAEHINYARKNNVTLLTIKEFRNRFFKGQDYIAKRRNAPFGSARNVLDDGSVTIPENEYVELPMSLCDYDQGIYTGRTAKTREAGLSDLIERVQNGDVVILTAPFGSGKSLTTREVFLTLSKSYNRGDIEAAPVAVNLREHWGQIYSYEILERHAKSIGFTPKETLTIAYRAGIIFMLIDGFDEVASQVVARTDKVNFMREARYKALEGSRDLISKVPKGVGVLICGRDHYFDNVKEMVHALGINSKPFVLFQLGEFTDEQAQIYLKKKGLEDPLPDWLPRKPLLLGYLAHRDLLKEILRIDASQGFGYAWDRFLQLICEREASLERSVMDPETVRHVLERLACDVRSTLSGTGPIRGIDLSAAYRQETGQSPDEGVLAQLQRLPGLTERGQEPGARSFIDEDLLAALQGGAIARALLGELRGIGGKGWLSPISQKAMAMASYILKCKGADHTTVLASGRRVALGDTTSLPEKQIEADSLMIAVEMARDEEQIDCRGVHLTEVQIGHFDIEEVRINNLTLQDCVIDQVILGPIGANSSLRFSDCLINKLSGVASEQGLPKGMFINCSFESFDNLSNTAAVMRSSLPPSLKALASVLRKLYLQAGGGRRLTAFKKGVPSGPVMDAIDDVLRILENENLITINGTVAHPIRKQAARVLKILEAPNLSSDPIVVRVKEL